MKIKYWQDDTYKKTFGKETQFDLMVAIVEYSSGDEGKLYVNRAKMNMMKFEQEHIGKVMTENDFEDYKDLIREVADVDRSYEENED